MKNELTNHVVSLELAKELKEAGYPQESLFHWMNIEPDVKPFPEIIREDQWEVLSTDELPNPKEMCAAPLASELGEQLPAMIKGHDLTIKKFSEVWGIGYTWVSEQDDKNEANARAKMWLYLKKEGFL